MNKCHVPKKNSLFGGNTVFLLSGLMHHFVIWLSLAPSIRESSLKHQKSSSLVLVTGDIGIKQGEIDSNHSWLHNNYVIFGQVGDELPDVEVFEGDPGTKVNMKELFKGKKGVLFAVPGAFTPGCSKVKNSIKLTKCTPLYEKILSVWSWT